MLNIKIICVGKLKEKYWQDACAEYIKRLGAYCRIEIDEVREERVPANASPADEVGVVDAEGRNILERIGRSDYAVALDIGGKELSSEELASAIGTLSFSNSCISFLIGGSLGLSDEVRKRANLLVSFGRITLPHQLARVVALEQIYRAFKINAHETYHK